MAYVPSRFYMGLASTTNTDLYTVTGLAIIKQLTFSNTTDDQAMVHFYIVPEGAAPAKDNEILCRVLIQPRSVLGLNLSQVLEAGDRIVARRDETGEVTITISGVMYR